MASEHETFIQGLAALGAHMGHPDAKALMEKAKEFVESEEAKLLDKVAHVAVKVDEKSETQTTKELNEASLAAAKAQDAPPAHS